MEARSPIGRQPSRGRTATACLECQRRKKKCNRQWPCDHCQNRNLSHLCQFRTAKPRRNLAEPEKSSLDIARRSPEPPRSRSDSTLSPAGCSLAVKELSYVDSDIFKILQGNIETPEPSGYSVIPNQVLQATRAVPPRPYTDILVQNFFDSVNYHYCILHYPYFMTQYTNWWVQRRELRDSPSFAYIAFTCLVLRICSNSTQFLMPSTIAKLESDLGESISYLGTNYHDAAQTLSAFLPPGAGGLANAQQLFLAATWFKGEGDFVSSWHQLAASVRHAQEIGIHKDSMTKEMTEFERELRRRLWCAVCTWDRFMVATFNRAPIIQSGKFVPLPNPKLDQSLDEPDIPSIVLAKVLENQLTGQFCDDNLAEIGLENTLSLIEDWMNMLPAVFGIVDADTRWDTRHPRLVFQRLQLHSTGYMAQIMLLRPTIQNIERADPQKLILTVDISLKCMEVSRCLFDICFPQQAKYFMVPFCPFDNAAFLCSIIIKDGKGNRVPRRLEVIAAIGEALYMCNKLRKATKLGDTTWNILMALVSRIELKPSERSVLEQIRGLGNPSDAMGRAIINTVSENHEPSSLELGVTSQSADIPEGNWGMWEPSITSVSQFENIDLGVLDGVWDWNALGLGDMGPG